MNRRQWIRTTTAGAIAGTYARGIALLASAAESQQGLTLSIGTYSLKGIALEGAVRLVAGIWRGRAK